MHNIPLSKKALAEETEKESDTSIVHTKRSGIYWSWTLCIKEIIACHWVCSMPPLGVYLKESESQPSNTLSQTDIDLWLSREKILWKETVRGASPYQTWSQKEVTLPSPILIGKKDWRTRQQFFSWTNIRIIPFQGPTDPLLIKRELQPPLNP